MKIQTHNRLRLVALAGALAVASLGLAQAAQLDQQAPVLEQAVYIVDSYAVAAPVQVVNNQAPNVAAKKEFAIEEGQAYDVGVLPSAAFTVEIIGGGHVGVTQVLAQTLIKDSHVQNYIDVNGGGHWGVYTTDQANNGLAYIVGNGVSNGSFNVNSGGHVASAHGQFDGISGGHVASNLDGGHLADLHGNAQLRAANVQTNINGIAT